MVFQAPIVSSGKRRKDTLSRRACRLSREHSLAEVILRDRKMKKRLISRCREPGIDTVCVIIGQSSGSTLKAGQIYLGLPTGGEPMAVYG